MTRPHPPTPARDAAPPPAPDLGELAGFSAEKRALEIAAAGGHAVLLVGRPGAGKTTLALALHRLLPDPPPEDRAELVALHALASTRPPWVDRQRPARLAALAPERLPAPRHASAAGGGKVNRPCRGA
jgi:magnesium chelatase family protein